MKYRKKPVVIDAIRWSGKNTDEIDNFSNSQCIHVTHGGIEMLEIYTLEGVMKALVGDFIIRGIEGEYYPCKPQIFEATYEAVE